MSELIENDSKNLKTQVPARFTEVHPDLKNLPSHQKNLYIGIACIFIGLVLLSLCPLVLSQGSATNTLRIIVGIVLAFGLALKYFLSRSRDWQRNLHASWILRSEDPIAVTAQQMNVNIGSEKNRFAKFFELEGDFPQTVEAYAISENDVLVKHFSPKPIETSRKVKLRVYFDKANHQAVCAEDDFGMRYWLRVKKGFVVRQL